MTFDTRVAWVVGCVAVAACSSQVASLGSGVTPSDASVVSPSDASAGTRSDASTVADARPGTPDASHAPADGAADASACTVLASQFDQTCLLDLDCAPVAEGDWCSSPCLACAPSDNAAINASALSAYTAATTAAAPVGGPGCACGTGAGGVGWNGEAAYCDNGVCVAGVRSGSGSGKPTATRLPSCTVPASVTPSVPDGSVAGWSVSRTLVKCGGCATSNLGAGCSSGPSDTSSPCGDAGSCGPCVLACRDNEYAVATEQPALNPLPANVVLPTLPAGCHGPIGSFPWVQETSYSCCPCQ